MSELDDLFERLYNDWEADPKALKNDQPLMARAFEKAATAMELERALTRAKKETADAHDRQGTLCAEIDRLQTKLSDLEVELSRQTTIERLHEQIASERVIHQRELSKVERPTEEFRPVLTFDPGEQEAIAERGWKKGV